MADEQNRSVMLGILANAKSQRQETPQGDTLRVWAEKKVKQRREFRQHLAVYIVVNTILWVIWLITGAGFPWPIFALLGWGIGVGAHYVEYQQKYGRGYNAASNAIEAEIQREIQRERRRQQKIQDIVDRERRNSDDDGPIRFE